MTVSWLADSKLFVRGTTATTKGHSAQLDAPDRRRSVAAVCLWHAGLAAWWPRNRAAYAVTAFK